MDDLANHLANAKQCGVFHLTANPSDIEHSAKTAALGVFRISLARARGKDEFLSRVSKALKFPSWFGGNWDALNDCLADLSWLDEKGWILVFEGSKAFAVNHEEDFDTAVDVLRTAAGHWRDEGKPFWAFFHGAESWNSGLPKFPGV